MPARALGAILEAELNGCTLDTTVTSADEEAILETEPNGTPETGIEVKCDGKGGGGTVKSIFPTLEDEVPKLDVIAGASGL